MIVLIAKEINISSPYNNRQLRHFPLEEVAPEPQKVEPTFNRVSRQIAVEELPSSNCGQNNLPIKPNRILTKYSRPAPNNFRKPSRWKRNRTCL
jgi:hypothetical protein